VKVAVVGFGAMGREVAAVLIERGHEVAPVRRDDPLPACPVGIDFSVAASVPGNVQRAMALGMRYVVGTTGWSDHLEDVTRTVAAAAGGLVHAANFSLGVNLFYKAVREAAALMARFPDYEPYVLERHHRRKRDAPSGTARELAAIVQAATRRQPVTQLDGALPAGSFQVASLRAGGIVGDHTVGFDSGFDEIRLEHSARSRRGFALGAVRAAEWIAGKSGCYAFEEILDRLGDASRPIG